MLCRDNKGMNTKITCTVHLHGFVLVLDNVEDTD